MRVINFLSSPLFKETFISQFDVLKRLSVKTFAIANVKVFNEPTNKSQKKMPFLPKIGDKMLLKRLEMSFFFIHLHA